MPSPHGPVADGNLRWHLEAAGLDVDQQFAPALRALANADLEADESFFPSGVAPRMTSIHSACGSIRAWR